jgi:hypothetical protein
VFQVCDSSRALVMFGGLLDFNPTTQAQRHVLTSLTSTLSSSLRLTQPRDTEVGVLTKKRGSRTSSPIRGVRGSFEQPCTFLGEAALPNCIRLLRSVHQLWSDLSIVGTQNTAILGMRRADVFALLAESGKPYRKDNADASETMLDMARLWLSGLRDAGYQIVSHCARHLIIYTSTQYLASMLEALVQDLSAMHLRHMRSFLRGPVSSIIRHMPTDPVYWTEITPHLQYIYQTYLYRLQHEWAQEQPGLGISDVTADHELNSELSEVIRGKIIQEATHDLLVHFQAFISPTHVSQTHSTKNESVLGYAAQRFLDTPVLFEM